MLLHILYVEGLDPHNSDHDKTLSVRERPSASSAVQFCRGLGPGSCGEVDVCDDGGVLQPGSFSSLRRLGIRRAQSGRTSEHIFRH